jgi:hypothetical protein
MSYCILKNFKNSLMFTANKLWEKCIQPTFHQMLHYSRNNNLIAKQLSDQFLQITSTGTESMYSKFAKCNRTFCVILIFYTC